MIRLIFNMPERKSRIHHRRTNNRLTFNDSNTEVLTVVPSSNNDEFPSAEISRVDALVKSTSNTNGIVFDRNMTLLHDIVTRCRTFMYHLRNTRTIRRFGCQWESALSIIFSVLRFKALVDSAHFAN